MYAQPVYRRRHDYRAARLRFLAAWFVPVIAAGPPLFEGLRRNVGRLLR